MCRGIQIVTVFFIAPDDRSSAGATGIVLFARSGSVRRPARGGGHGRGSLFCRDDPKGWGARGVTISKCMGWAYETYRHGVCDAGHGYDPEGIFYLRRRPFRSVDVIGREQKNDLVRATVWDLDGAPDGGREVGREVGYFPFSEDAGSFLMIRSEDRTKLLVLGFESVPSSPPKLHALAVLTRIGGCYITGCIRIRSSPSH